MSDWEIGARITVRCVVVVEAATAEEALRSFNDGRWVDDTRQTGEACDWEAVSDPLPSP